jgi:hypothetical protein
MNAVLVVSLFAFAPTGTVAPPAPPQGDHRVAVETIRLRTDGVDAAAFARELALRVPSARIVEPQADAATAGGFTVLVDLRRDADDAWSLTVVTSDGRAYDRRVAADASSTADDTIRLLAGNVGNLVAAIEAGTARPDREDVAMPLPTPLVPQCPACPPPKPPSPCPEPPTATAPTRPRPPRFEIGIGAAPTIAIGLGEPDDTDRFVGAGGAIGVSWRDRTGALLGAEVRVLGRKLAFETSVLRTRIGLDVGYAWRRGGFELAATAGLGIEPWSVRAAGSRRRLGDADGDARTQRPLVGGNLRIVPAHRFELRGASLRVGPRLELSASSAIGDRGRVAQLVVVDGDDLVGFARIGGWELGVGVDVTVWIPVRPRRRS